MTGESEYDYDEDEDRFDIEDDEDLDDDDFDDDDFDDDLDDDLDNSDNSIPEKPLVDDNDVEIDAFIDGQMDTENGNTLYANYGISHPEDELTDKQKDIYEDNYLAGLESAEESEDEDY